MGNAGWEMKYNHKSHAESFLAYVDYMVRSNDRFAEMHERKAKEHERIKNGIMMGLILKLEDESEEDIEVVPISWPKSEASDLWYFDDELWADEEEADRFDEEMWSDE